MKRIPLAEIQPIRLPWPDRMLHPNARPHWAVKSTATKAARHNAQLLALEAKWNRLELPEGRLHLFWDFYPPSRRRFDDDGLLSSMKAARDGIAEALGIDDNRFVSHPMRHDEIRHGGEVYVRITGAPE